MHGPLQDREVNECMLGPTKERIDRRLGAPSGLLVEGVRRDASGGDYGSILERFFVDNPLILATLGLGRQRVEAVTKEDVAIKEPVAIVQNIEVASDRRLLGAPLEVGL